MTTPVLEPAREHAPHGVRWLILARLMVLILSLCVLLVRGLAASMPTFGPRSVYVLLLSLAVLNILYLVLLPMLRGRRALNLFVAFQFVVDILAETGLVFFTGGVGSNYVNLYFVSIMAAPMLLSRRNSALCASLATVGLATVTTLYLTKTGMAWVPPSYRPAIQPNLEDSMAWMLAVVTAFFVVAYLSGLLSERLATAHSLNEEILQNMAEGVAVFDADGHIRFFNREFEQLFGQGRAIQFGESLENVLPHGDDEPLRRVIAAGAPASFEVPERLDPGQERPHVEVRLSRLGDAETRLGMVVLAIDLTLQQRAEAAERRAERFSAVSEMAAGLAHEIRNPLASVRGSIQEISREFPEDDPNRKLADIALRESDRLDRVITNFLQFARQRSLRPANCRLSNLLNEVKILLENRPDAAGVEIQLIVGDNEPWVRCDAEQIREVLLNLGVNAVAALQDVPEDRRRLILRCPHPGAMPPDTHVLRGKTGGVAVSIADSGPGLSPGTEDRVFEPFYTTKARGSGLGLSIAQKVVQAHDGRIWVRNAPGDGATFFVWLPESGPYAPGVPSVSDPSSVS